MVIVPLVITNMRDGMTTLALKARTGQRTRIPVKSWEVWQAGKLIFENKYYALCKYHVRVNALKNCIVKGVR